MILDYFEYFVHRHLKVCENVFVRFFYHNLNIDYSLVKSIQQIHNVTVGRKSSYWMTELSVVIDLLCVNIFMIISN